MLLQNFAMEMERRGCVTDGENFCGTYQGYPFSVLYLKNMSNRNKTAFALRMQFDSKVSGILYSSVRGAMKGLAKVQKAQTSATLYNMMVTVKRDDGFAQAFDTVMDASARTAQSLGLVVPAACPICKQAGCDAYAFHGASYQPAHAYCVQNQAAGQNAKVEQNELNGSYGLGFIGAVLGGLVGAIPNIALAVFMNVISWWLCALIPLGAYYGYKLLRGRMNKVALLMTILVSVLLTPVVYYLMQDLSVYKEYGYFFGPAAVWELFQMYPEQLLPGLLQTLLFTGIGIFVVSGIISRTNTHTVKAANYSLATLRPMPGVAAPGQAPVSMGAPAPAPMPAQSQIPGQPMM